MARAPLALGAFAWTATTLTASAVLVLTRYPPGALPWSRALLWQGLVYGAWIPIAPLLAWSLSRARGPGRAVAAVYGLGLALVPAHAVLAGLLDAAFSPRVGVDAWRRLAGERAPVDLLIYTALVALVLGWSAHRRAVAEADRARELEGALATARAALAVPKTPPAERLLVSLGARRVPVAPAEVEWFGAAGNYVVVNWNGREGLLRATLSGLEKELDPAVFARVHRSTVVNLARVASAEPLSDGSWRLRLQSGAELVASRSHRDAVLSRLRTAAVRP